MKIEANTQRVLDKGIPWTKITVNEVNQDGAAASITVDLSGSQLVLTRTLPIASPLLAQVDALIKVGAEAILSTSANLDFEVALLDDNTPSIPFEISAIPQVQACLAAIATSGPLRQAIAQRGVSSVFSAPISSFYGQPTKLFYLSAQGQMILQIAGDCTLVKLYGTVNVELPADQQPTPSAPTPAPNQPSDPNGNAQVRGDSGCSAVSSPSDSLATVLIIGLAMLAYGRLGLRRKRDFKHTDPPDAVWRIR
jgi:hypothetical protein